MNYLVTLPDEAPFLTAYFCEEFFNKEAGMIVYDLIYFKYTIDGKKWEDIVEDSL
jgi:hypothetical protein